MAKLSLWTITAWVAHDDNPPQLWIDVLVQGKIIVALNANAAKIAAQIEVDEVNAGLDHQYATADLQINVSEIKANV